MHKCNSRWRFLSNKNSPAASLWPFLIRFLTRHRSTYPAPIHVELPGLQWNWTRAPDSDCGAEGTRDLPLEDLWSYWIYFFWAPKNMIHRSTSWVSGSTIRTAFVQVCRCASWNTGMADTVTAPQLMQVIGLLSRTNLADEWSVNGQRWLIMINAFPIWFNCCYWMLMDVNGCFSRDGYV